MITKNLQSLFILLLLPFYLTGNVSIEKESMIFGIVKNKSNKLPYITIHVKGTSRGTASDLEGSYALFLESGTYTIHVQGIGYKTLERTFTIEPLSKIEVDFELEEEVLQIDQITVTGSRIGLLRYLPGSATTVKESDIRNQQSVSSNEVFQQVAGLHTVEEEGAGLRANVGIRGLDPDKSRSVLILEDGIPVALGPYGEPEMYYTPSIDRMKGVEVLKGNGQIRFGPQTIGGVINYITADPPSEAEGTIQLKGGQGGFFNGILNYGSSFGNTGYTFNYLRKHADKLGPTQFKLDDMSGKFSMKTGIRSTLQLKWNIYNERSNATYVGLTQPMYDSKADDYIVIAPNDKLDVRRYALSATQDYHLSDQLSFSTTAYGYTTTRNWMRQDFTYNANATNLTGKHYGDPDQPEGAIYMRNSTGNRNRQFEVAGLEPRLKAVFNIAGKKNQTDAGIRFHYERAFEQRINGKVADALSGDLRDDEIRTGLAFSAYMQNKWMLSESFALTYGLRMESLDYERKILRVAGKDTTIVAQSKVFDIIPGIGFNWNLNENTGIYGGIHRGFAPPRIKDAISNNGQNMQLDAEKSWNSELGTRWTLYNLIETELTFFLMDFSNQVIPVSESSGGTGSGFINGGATRHAGAEFTAKMILDRFLPEKFKLNLRFNTTFVESTFRGDRFEIEKIGNKSVNDTIWMNISGNDTPYAPDWLANGFVTFETTSGIGIQLQLSYIDKQFTDAINTKDVYQKIQIANDEPDYTYIQATASGRVGELPSYLLAHVSAWYLVPRTGLELSACVKNVFNERYIVSRRPQGIRVGLNRFFTAGVTYKF
jgi:Fe(3+) dicitrate transport protein